MSPPLAAYERARFSAIAISSSGVSSMSEANEISDWLKVGKDTLGLFKDLVGLLPKGEKADKATADIAKAEKLLRESEAKLAQMFGYRLCQCDLPPHPMLSKGHHPVYGMEIFVCRSCGKQEPSEHMIAQHAKVSAHNQARGNSWADARRGGPRR